MTGLRVEVEVDRLMAELGELATHSDAACACRHARRLFR